MVEGAGFEPTQSNNQMLLFIHVPEQSNVLPLCHVRFRFLPPTTHWLSVSQEIPYGIMTGFEPVTYSFEGNCTTTVQHVT